MAHLITVRKNGMAEFASAKEKAWHGLGQILPNVMTSEEAIREAGLDWDVFQTRLAFRYRDANGNRKMHTTHQSVANWRFLDDEAYELGVVTDKYEVVQNTEAFDFFDSIVGKGEAIYETAGSIRGGKKVFITAKFPDHIVFDNDPSKTDLYAVISMGHDGRAGSAIQVIFTPVRVVCNNTLHFAMQRKVGNKVVIRHTKNAHERMKAGSEILKSKDLFITEFEQFASKAQQTLITDDQFVIASAKVLRGIKIDADQELNAALQADIDNLLEYYHEDETQVDIRGTVWGAYNAWGSYLQRKPSKIEGKSFDDYIKGSPEWNRKIQVTQELLSV